MVNKKILIPIVILLSLFLSLNPNFLYNGRGALADCPAGCTPEERDGETYCINCPIPCEIGAETFANKSCLPLEGTGEWTCGTEIPVGEVMDRTAYLAGRMLAEIEGMIDYGRQMADKADEFLTGYKDWNCQNCQTGCYKFYHIAAGVLKAGQDPSCPAQAQFVPRGIYAGDECKADASQCKSCDECGESCCWPEEYIPDPEKPKEVITCQYCKKEGENPEETEEPYCKEICSPYSCWGCCDQYFWPIITGFTEMENLHEALKNDIDEKDSPEKFKKSYILEQLDFSRCELAKCWIPAEDYPDVLSGKKVGKHLLTCETVSQMGLFDEDQINCSTIQIENEWDEIDNLWAEMEKAPWWQRPIFNLQILWKTIQISGKILWEMLGEWFNFSEEEGCYPTNFYCCQM